MSSKIRSGSRLIRIPQRSVESIRVRDQEDAEKNGYPVVECDVGGESFDADYTGGFLAYEWCGGVVNWGEVVLCGRRVVWIWRGGGLLVEGHGGLILGSRSLALVEEPLRRRF